MYVKIHVLKAVLVILLLAMLPVIPTYANVLYNGNSFYVPHLFTYCKNDKDCRHEVAHIMDHDLKDPSKSVQYGIELGAYLSVQFRYGESNVITDTIMTAPGLLLYSDLFSQTGLEAWSSPQQELYAQLYANVDGDLSKMPGTIAQFYSNDPKYERIYQHLRVHKIIFFQ